MFAGQLLLSQNFPFEPSLGGPVWAGVCAALSLAYLGLFLVYRMAWDRLPDLHEGNPLPPENPPFVSVVLPARNEASAIGRCVSALLRQDYPHACYEILLIDDHSTDGTADIARLTSGNDPRLKVIDLASELERDPKHGAFKKKAIEIAISKAQGEVIASTDADAVVGESWLSRIISARQRNRWKLVAGPVTFFSAHGFLSRFQDLDLISLVGIAGASIRMGFYNLCNGANLAYDKAAFEAVDGFRDIDNLPSGDDMMLMHKIGRRFPGQVGFLKDQRGIVRTDVEPDIWALLQQRVRWASKSTHYEDWRITGILAAVWLYNFSIPMNLILGAVDPVWFRIGIVQFLVKAVADIVFQLPVVRFFSKTRLLWSFLPLEIAHILYVVVIGPWSTFAPYKWKGRHVPAARRSS